jgi:hypothetical protein
LCKFTLANLAFDHYLVVELHKDAVGTFNLRCRFAVWTLELFSLQALFPLVNTVRTKQFFTVLALFGFTDHIHANQAAKIVFNFLFRLQMNSHRQLPD